MFWQIKQQIFCLPSNEITNLIWLSQVYWTYKAKYKFSDTETKVYNEVVRFQIDYLFTYK